MRFVTQVDISPPPPRPRAGERRSWSAFLWWPRTISRGSGVRETRWLETVEVEQVYCEVGFMFTDGGGYPVLGWTDVAFRDPVYLA